MTQLSRVVNFKNQGYILKFISKLYTTQVFEILLKKIYIFSIKVKLQ